MQDNQQYSHRHGMGIFGWVVLGLLALLVIGALAGPMLWGNYYGMMGPNYTGPYPFMGWFFWPFGAFFIFFLVFFAFRWLWFPWGRGYYGRWHRYDDAGEILKQRYARGEITKDQFDQIMRDLEQHK